MAFVSSFVVGSRSVVGGSLCAGRRADVFGLDRKVKRVWGLRMQDSTDDPEDEAEDEAPSDTAMPVVEEEETEETAETFEKLKSTRLGLTTQLLELCAMTNRGQTATADQKSQIEDIVAKLESQNPTPEPNDSDEINGMWNLVYLSSPFYKATPLLAATATPFLDVGQVRQIISVDTEELINEVDVIAFPFITGTVKTNARITPISVDRLELTIEKASVKGNSAFERIDLGGLKIDIPIEQIYQRIRGTLPEAYFDTYYLDERIRVSRGKGSKLFVFAKLS